MKAYLFIIALLIAFPALAQTKAKVEAEPLKPIEGEKAPKGQEIATPPAVEGEEPELTPEEQALLICQTKGIMSEYPVAPAEYQPGVDVDGNAVASADINAAPVYSVPERIDIPLNVVVLETIGVTPSPELQTNVGTVSVLKGGQVLFNGQDMTTDLQEFCNSRLEVKVD